MRRTKIVATIGPATDSPDVLAGLVSAGIDIARLNASHSGPDELQTRFQAVREASARAGRQVAVMLDLAGPKLRIGEVEPGTVLEAGSEFVLCAGECLGDPRRACVSYRALSAEVAEGTRLLLDDGRLELRVLGVRGDEIVTEVILGGALGSHKGLNLPGVTLGMSPITPADLSALEWGLEAGVDFVAQSFVRSAADVRVLRERIPAGGPSLVAKIEKHEAVDALEEIVEAADAVMVARGDLGVETAPERVPVIQMAVIATARATGKPVIVATQMLESMVSAPRPTRAEASDVATAIFQGADAVMLSAETAIGAYPVDAVAVADRIARSAEEAHGAPANAVSRGSADDVAAAVSAAVCDLASELRLDAIVVATQSGSTARSVASHRPPVPIVAATPSEGVARQLALVWGVRPLVVPLADDTDAMLAALLEGVRRAGLVPPGGRVAVTAGRATRVPGATDFMLVTEVPG